ncbi:MAG: sigma-54 dependent transcriptional regulator [Bryobacteraceae bacterium]
MPNFKILAIDDDLPSLDLVISALEQKGVDILGASDPEEGLALFKRERPEIVLVDLMMPNMNGIEVLKQIVKPESGSHRGELQTIVIMLTAFGTVETAVEAMKAGAYDYLAKPLHVPELRIVVERALEHLRLRAEIWRLRRALDSKYGFESILGRSKRLLSVLDMAGRAAQTTSTVLIRGETGTGKELLARAIHFNSPRKEKPFYTINCGAIPKDLLESELFGHVKGSFTGAVTHKTGKVEAADQGTLFLDEIGDMPLELQVKMLRLVQHGEIEKVGATSPMKVDVRIVAATHRNLQAMIEDQTFREDLYYRLSIIPLELPPLRERPDDIPELVRLFFQRAGEKHGRQGLRLPEELIPRFKEYRWPGNVREMENVVERLVVLADGDLVRSSDLPDFLRSEPNRKNTLHLNLPPEGISLESIERELILIALRKFDWNQSHAAKYLDLSRKTLIYRMEKFGLRREQGEQGDSEAAGE